MFKLTNGFFIATFIFIQGCGSRVPCNSEAAADQSLSGLLKDIGAPPGQVLCKQEGAKEVKSWQFDLPSEEPGKIQTSWVQLIESKGWKDATSLTDITYNMEKASTEHGKCGAVRHIYKKEGTTNRLQLEVSFCNSGTWIHTITCEGVGQSPECQN